MQIGLLSIFTTPQYEVRVERDVVYAEARGGSRPGHLTGQVKICSFEKLEFDVAAILNANWPTNAPTGPDN